MKDKIQKIFGTVNDDSDAAPEVKEEESLINEENEEVLYAHDRGRGRVQRGGQRCG